MNITEIDKYSKIEVFELIKNHLLTQNKKSVDVIGQCMYRNSTGLSCAVGCLMTAEQAEKADALKDSSWFVVSRQYPELSRKHYGTLEKLQYTHDNLDDWNCEFDRLEQELLDNEG